MFLFQARILYSDQRGRAALAVRFNQAIYSGDIKGNEGNWSVFAIKFWNFVI